MIGLKFINLYKPRAHVPEAVKGCYIKFEGLAIEKKSDRRAFLQSIVSSINKRGYDSSVAPVDLSDNFDIIILNITKEEASNIISKYSNLGPRAVEAKIARKDVFERAWQNKARIELMRKGFWKIGDRYILERDIVDKNNIFKRSYRIQAVLPNLFPSLFIDPRTRIMIPLKKEQIDLADSLGEESKVVVRVLPHWQRGILVGKVERKAGDMEFPIGNRMHKTPDYWRIKHDIHFVKQEDEMLDVYIPAYEKTLPYPKACVFSDFKSGTPLPENLKKIPQHRVIVTREFIKNHLNSIEFLGQKIILEGPTTLSSLGYQEYSFPPHSRFNVIVGSDKITNVSGLLNALRQHGPYAGKLNGSYVVIHCRDGGRIFKALKSVERVYSQLNLGKLELLSNVGNNGLIDAGGESVADYTSTIAQLRLHLKTIGQKAIVMIVLPDIYASEIYYKSRDKLFERIFGLEPVPAQAVSLETINTIVEGKKKAYPICVTLTSQCYIKLGGTGAAVWILQDAGDAPIPGIPAGSSCYAYHDVSRRPKKKASATAYSAMTDSYGRYIATGTKPVGGEKLTPSIFYDILVEILQKVSMFNQKYVSVAKGKSFHLKRLVFAKDGIIRDDEAEMMENVIFKGIPEERKEPIPNLLKKISMFPRSLIIDIIDVNKTPNKRIFERIENNFDNVFEGTAVSYNDFEGLLAACSSHIGTVQPIEISIKKHLCLNMENVPKPHISQILEEYYRLTFLNWASIFKQGKYALPQILTQNLGKNISAGVIVPDDMILL